VLASVIAVLRTEYGADRAFALDLDWRSDNAGDGDTLTRVGEELGLALVRGSDLLTCPDEGLSGACRLSDPRRILRLGEFQAGDGRAELDLDLLFGVEEERLALLGFRAEFVRGDAGSWDLDDLRLVRMH